MGQIFKNNLGRLHKSLDSASSLFLRYHPEGNCLIDSPRFVLHLARKFEEMGGIRYIFLTHHDDIADAPRYAKHFGAERIIHEHEKKAQPNAEILTGESVPFEWAPDFRIIPTPGHTRGHMVLLYRNKFLFTGYHLAWSLKSDGLVAFPDHCWYSWDQQLDSLARLAEESFEWILPEHGEQAKRGWWTCAENYWNFSQDMAIGKRGSPLTIYIDHRLPCGHGHGQGISA